MMNLIATTGKWCSISFPLSSVRCWGSFIRKSSAPTSRIVRERISSRWIIPYGNSWSYYQETKVYTARWVICQRALLYAQTFSKVIKQACGRTPSDLINETAMEQIKYRLKHSDKSIKEIAEEFNFPNQSFFGKYVKAYLGTSPASYRSRKEDIWRNAYFIYSVPHNSSFSLLNQKNACNLKQHNSQAIPNVYYS